MNIKYSSHRCNDDVTTNPIWQTDAILKIVRFLAISKRHIVQLTRNLKWRSRITRRNVSHDQINKFRKFKTPILKMVISSYLGCKSSDFDEIWCADAQFASEICHLTNCTILVSFIPPQWVKPCPSLFTHKLCSLHLPWYAKLTLSGPDPGGMKCINVNNKTANINVQNCNLYTR